MRPLRSTTRIPSAVDSMVALSKDRDDASASSACFCNKRSSPERISLSIIVAHLAWFQTTFGHGSPLPTLPATVLCRFVALAAPELFLTSSKSNSLAICAKSGELTRFYTQDSSGTTRGQVCSIPSNVHVNYLRRLLSEGGEGW